MQQESRQVPKLPSEHSGFLNRRRSSGNSEEETLSLEEYWKILKRRRYLFALPAIGIFLAVLIYALNMSAMYRSEATILIEDQAIPEGIVGATIANYASQQIQIVSQRLFTVRNIEELVERLDVYAPTDVPVRATVLAKRFREDMELDVISAEMLGPGGQSVETAVAFILAFNSPDPDVALNVTQELVTLFQSENQRSSSSRAAGVSGLLRSAIADANKELLSSEADLADFKVRHEGALPELFQLNLGVINRAEQQLSDVSLRLGELEQRRLQLSIQLSSLSPSAPVILPSGEIVMGDRERLRSLMVDYRRKSAIYQASHPDLVRLEREIESLRSTVGETATYTIVKEQLRQERERLNILRDRYSDNHPDIKNSEAAIAELQSQLAATNPRDSAQIGVVDNPAYILIKTQLQATDLEVRSMLQKRRELQASIAEHEALIKQAPHVEMEYEVLLRTYENIKTKHNELQAKLRAADVAANVEQEITGQRFTLIEPPLLPVVAEPRHRISILFLGALLAGAIGAGCVVVAEIMDHSIRSAKVLENIVGAPPLAVIPYLDNSADIAHSRNRRILFISAFLGGTAVFIAYVINFV